MNGTEKQGRAVAARIRSGSTLTAGDFAAMGLSGGAFERYASGHQSARTAFADSVVDRYWTPAKVPSADGR